MAGIFNGLADVLDAVLRLYLLVLLIAVVLQLVQANPTNAIVVLVRNVTEPVLRWVRQRLPFVIAGGFDFSPLVIWLVVIFLQRALVDNLRLIGR